MINSLQVVKRKKNNSSKAIKDKSLTIPQEDSKGCFTFSIPREQYEKATDGFRQYIVDQIHKEDDQGFWINSPDMEITLIYYLRPSMRGFPGVIIVKHGSVYYVHKNFCKEVMGITRA